MRERCANELGVSDDSSLQAAALAELPLYTGPVAGEAAIEIKLHNCVTQRV